jgi:hypothetical protein
LQKNFSGIKDFNEFVKNLLETLRELGIGILRVEEADIEKGLAFESRRKSIFNGTSSALCIT